MLFSISLNYIQDVSVYFHYLRDRIIHIKITYTVKPRPEAHMDMILFEVHVFEEYLFDSTRSDSTMTLSII